MFLLYEKVLHRFHIVKVISLPGLIVLDKIKNMTSTLLSVWTDYPSITALVYARHFGRHYTSQENDMSGSSTNPAFVKHALEHTWTLWFDNPNG